MAFAAVAGPIAGALVGGLMGGDGGGGQQTATKTPWEPAIKPLTNSLTTGQDLERYYQQNPFNRPQQQGYQNLYSDLDQYRNQIQPRLMQFSNDMMGYNYQRGPRNSQVEAMQSQMPMQGSTRPQMMSQGSDGTYAPQGGQGGGLAGGMGQMQGGSPMGGLLGLVQSGGRMADYYNAMPQGQSAPQGLLQGAFSAPTQGNYGLLDFLQLNPFTATNGIPQTPVAEKPAEKTPDQLAEEERRRRQMSGEGFRGEGA